MPLFDTHAHLVDEQLTPIIAELLACAEQAGLVGITSVGTTLATSQGCVALAKQHEGVFAAVGIHPNDCHHADDQQWDEIVELAADEKVVAIGETGLDRHWDDCPIGIQKEWFARHIELSFATEKPLVVHMRDCESDILEMFAAHQRNGQIIGIMHSFTGEWETAQRCLDWGMYLSFSGMVTFKKSDELRTIAGRIPNDRILVETDSPYLSPHPCRGTRPNQPSLVQHTAACIAEVRGVSPEDFGELTTRNARRVFGVS